MSYPAMLMPHDYSVLFHLACWETDETAPLGQGREGNTVRDLYPTDWEGDIQRRREAGPALRSLERLGFVEREGSRGGRVVWTTTARGYETVFPS